MSEERRIILELLENKYITKDEALKLLAAIEKDNGESKKSNLEKELKKIGGDIEKLFSGMSKSATKTYEKYEPKVNEYTKKTVKTVKKAYEGVAKELSKTFKTDKEDKPKENKEDDIFEHDDFINKGE